MKKTVLALLASFGVVCSAGAADAVPPKTIGKLANLVGVVTVYRDNVTSTGSSNDPVLSTATRYTAAAGAGVLIKLDNGCDVQLKSSQSVVIQEGVACAALIAAIQTNTVVAAGAGGGVSMEAGAALLGGAALLLTTNQSNTSQTNQ